MQYVVEVFQWDYYLNVDGKVGLQMEVVIYQVFVVQGVWILQSELNLFGYIDVQGYLLVVDGVFGVNMCYVVEVFQCDYQFIVDGCFGLQIQGVLDEVLKVCEVGECVQSVLLLSDLKLFDYVFYEQVLVGVQKIDVDMGCCFDQFSCNFVVNLVVEVKVFGLMCIDLVVISENGVCMFVVQNESGVCCYVDVIIVQVVCMLIE